ncbi:family 90 glycosyltransferase [Melampsora larici-populina 98AG31]|uniref:Family 90 glycosyltransferase n=1 Tax=Melampsora larici-populina (strain 98AG31 / pathotype 3-4-7) TaxID=747676 RepID=F4S6U3_MELLP|nr:family 90 glycosyltransferase [Melampsora larici-populina 98AG31]EGF99663.1 family 90 glycosyltransferase [Melampsora larici-populina 98AG31]
MNISKESNSLPSSSSTSSLSSTSSSTTPMNIITSTSTNLNHHPNRSSNYQSPSSRQITTKALRHLIIIICPLLLLTSLFIIAIHHDIIPSLPSIPPLSSSDLRLPATTARRYSSQFLSWLDTVPSSINLLLPLPNFLHSSSKSVDQQPQSPHPILALLLSARLSWKAILQSQPTTLEAARASYIRRYHPLQPPPGFDEWYHFARNRNFTLIDRFDSLMSDLEPFRAVPPSELRRRTQELANLPGVSLIQINAKGEVEIKSQTGRLTPGKAMKDMLSKIISEGHWSFPQLDFAINEKSQARVLPKVTRPEKPSLTDFKPEWGNEGNVWDAYRRACPPDSAARRLVETVRSTESQTGAVAAGGGSVVTTPIPPRRELTFLEDLESGDSFCDRPSTHHLHSAFFTDLRSIEHLYPLFSAAKPAGFADILIPSHYHYNPTSEFVYEDSPGQSQSPTDIEWSQKASKLYWHGKLTRGANTPPGHMSSFQKQRLVKLVSNDTSSPSSQEAHHKGEADPSQRGNLNRILVTLNTSSSGLESVSIPATVVDPLLLDIAIACDPHAGECTNLNSQGYHTEDPRPLSESWRSKLALDLDQVGLSPRFGALMNSKSAVVKMSVQQEFWRDWVQSWLHFIPLSSSFSELHNLLTFFLGLPSSIRSLALPIHQTRDRQASGDTNPVEGFVADEELRKIGQAGQDWKRRHMRKEDMEVYMFRLMIEWARIVSNEEIQKKTNSNETVSSNLP